MTRTTLALLAPHQPAHVVAVEGRGAVRVRLLELGFLPGTRVEIVKRAPMGDPLEVRVRGFHVSLRRSDAGDVAVEVGA